jgi:hypothetical protein
MKWPKWPFCMGVTVRNGGVSGKWVQGLRPTTVVLVILRMIFGVERVISPLSLLRSVTPSNKRTANGRGPSCWSQLPCFCLKGITQIISLRPSSHFPSSREFVSQVISPWISDFYRTKITTSCPPHDEYDSRHAPACLPR